MKYIPSMILLLVFSLLNSAEARVCTWNVEGQVLDKNGVPAGKTKLRIKARWAGPHPWNTAN